MTALRVPRRGRIPLRARLWSTPGLFLVALVATFLITAGPIVVAGANPDRKSTRLNSSH